MKTSLTPSARRTVSNHQTKRRRNVPPLFLVTALQILAMAVKLLQSALVRETGAVLWLLLPLSHTGPSREALAAEIVSLLGGSLRARKVLRHPLAGLLCDLAASAIGALMTLGLLPKNLHRAILLLSKDLASAGAPSRKVLEGLKDLASQSPIRLPGRRGSVDRLALRDLLLPRSLSSRGLALGRQHLPKEASKRVLLPTG